MPSHLLMAPGFAVAAWATLRIGRYGYATLFLAALFETYAGLRYPFHVIVRDYLVANGPIPLDKGALQVALLRACAVAGGGIAILLWPRLRRQPAGCRLMAAGAATVMAVLGVELISLHPMDAWLYHPVGPAAPCAMIYLLGALLATGGAVMERRRQRRAATVAAAGADQDLPGFDGAKPG